MVSRRMSLGLFVGGAATILSGCSFGDRSSYKFRMTVEVKTPQGLKSGSSVLQVEVWRSIPIGDSSGLNSSVSGEAVAIELQDTLLFVLLQMPNAGPPLQTVVPHALLGRRSHDPDGVMLDTAVLRSNSDGTIKADLPRTDWPMMVRFRNINDPKTVELVDPAAIGVSRVVVETTSDAVTTGIEKKLPWLPKIYEMDIGPEFRPTGIPVGDFKRLFSTQLDN